MLPQRDLAHANTPDTLNTSASINSLNFVTAGTSLAGSGTVTLAATGTAGITDSAGTAGQTETVAPAVVLGSNQSWVATANSTLNVTGPISGPQSLALTGNGNYKFGGANTFQGLTVGTGSDTPDGLPDQRHERLGHGHDDADGQCRRDPGRQRHELRHELQHLRHGHGDRRARQYPGGPDLGDAIRRTANVLTLKATGASTIADANLTFNLNATSTASNQLSVGTTAIAFGTDPGSVKFTLNLQNEPAIVAATRCTP